MHRARAVCPKHGCPNLQPCAIHAPRPFERRAVPKPPRQSRPARQRATAAVIARDNGICHLCGRGGADAADHIIPLAAASSPLELARLEQLDNKKAAHRACNARKAGRDARTASRIRAARSAPDAARTGDNA